MTKKAGLRTEILLTLTLLLVAALLLGGLLMLRLTETRLLEERIHHLNVVTKTLSFLPIELQSGQLQRALKQLTETGQCDSWWLYNQDLQLLESFTLVPREPLNPSRRQQAQLTAETQRRISFPTLLPSFRDDIDTGVYYAIPLLDDNRFIGLIELHFSLDDIRRQLLSSLRILLLYVVLYGLVLTAAGYFLLQRNIIRPAQVLLRATEAVGRGSLNTRLPATGPHEIAQLAVAYNRMVEALRHSRAETGRHINELEQTNQQLQQVRDELIRSEKMASVGQLAAGLAHELGNPLAAVIGYLELLKQKVARADNKDIIERSLTETMRIDYLVRELLDFSRPQSVTVPEPVDLAAELRACCTLLRNQGSLGTIQIIDLLPVTLRPVMLNRQKLEQVLINLLLNAVHACSNQGNKGRIELSGGNDDSNVWIAVKDNGHGIPAENQQRIFDPFFTSKEPGSGTGLGLTICHRIVEEAGGRILVTSLEEVGSTFRLEFSVTGKMIS